MYIHKLDNAAASKISVTTTATGLFSLIDTASGTTHDKTIQGTNAIDLHVVDGDIRVLFDGNTPTSTNGIILKKGSVHKYRNVPLSKLQLISTGGTVEVNVQVGKSNPGESGSTTSGGGDGSNYDEGSNTDVVSVANPEWAKHVEETIADVTNGTDATYNYYLDMDGFKGMTTQAELSGGSGTATFTVEGSLQDDNTTAASCAYQDITQYGMTAETAAAAAASYTADVITSLKAGTNYKYVKLKLVASTSGSNDADWTFYVKRF